VLATPVCHVYLEPLVLRPCKAEFERKSSTIAASEFVSELSEHQFM
jgi:hypothetical protein